MAGRVSALMLATVIGAAAAGCGSSTAAASASVLGMLRLAPADGGTVTVNLYQRAATATGVPAPAAHSGAAAIARYFAALDQRAGVPGSNLTQAFNPDTTGVDLAGVRADMTAGAPPGDVLAALGRFDTTAIDKAAHADRTWRSALSTARVDGVTVYRWLPDNQLDMTRSIGLLSQIPESRRLAVSGGQNLLLTRNDATMHRVLDTTTHHAGSYAKNPDVSKVAGELDRLHAFAATITRQQPSATAVLGQHATPAQVAAVRQRLAGQMLRPYRLAGVGVTRLRGKPTMLVVLANADAATAKANATALAAAVRHGFSLRTNQPWSGLLTVDDVHANGDLTVATLTETGGAHLWSQIVQQEDSLLMRS